MKKNLSLRKVNIFIPLENPSHWLDMNLYPYFLDPYKEIAIDFLKVHTLNQLH